MNKTYFFLLIIFAALGSASCKKAVEGFNTDPNNPLDADAITMLTGIQVGNMAIQEGEPARIAGMWSGYFTWATPMRRRLFTW